MKRAIVLVLLCCVLFAQDKPAAETPKPASVENPAESKPGIPPINVRDELIELIHQLKIEAGVRIESPLTSVSDPAYQAALATKYEADKKAKTAAQQLLLQALVELAKEAAKEKHTKAWHSTNQPTSYDLWKDRTAK
jgi:hypothetical protein